MRYKPGELREIYLQWNLRDDPDGMTWCKDSVGEGDIPYVRIDIHKRLQKENARLKARIAELEAKPKKIYLVTSGYYSDYSVHAAYSDPEVAEKMREAFGLTDVEAYFLDHPDDLKPHEGETLYLIYFYDDGAIGNFHSNYRPLGASEWITIFDERYRKMNSVTRHGEKTQYAGYASIWARNYQHAIKIYSERRTLIIANNTYIPGEVPEENREIRF